MPIAAAKVTLMIPSKMSHGPIVDRALASLLAFSSAEADSVTYEWSTTADFISSTNREAIETVTGQIAFPVPNGFWVVRGSMNGTFTYDPDNADPPIQFGNFESYFGAKLASTASLFSETELIGTCTAYVGFVSVCDSDIGGCAGGGNRDVVTAFSFCEPPFFRTEHDPWRLPRRSVVWVGEGFRTTRTCP